MFRTFLRLSLFQVEEEEEDEEEEEGEEEERRQKLQQKWRVLCIMSAADAELQGVARKERRSDRPVSTKEYFRVTTVV